MKQITIIVSLLLFALNSYAQELKITEIMYNPAGADGSWEWVEIYNSGTTTIELSGYVLDDASGSSLAVANISTGSLEPQKSAILFDADDITHQEFRDVWGDVDLIAVNNWSTLGNTGDTIGIWSDFLSYDGDQKTQLNTVSSVAYDNDEEGWPKNDGQSSIFLIALDFDNTMGANWSLSSAGAETPLYTAYLSDRPSTKFTGDIGSPGVLTSTDDTEKPIILCPEEVLMVLEQDVCEVSFPLENPTATDNSDDVLTFQAVRSDGLELNWPYGIGETTITWTATDESGNVSLPCVQKVTVKDEGLPEIECPIDIEELSLDGEPVLLEITWASAFDFCDSQIAVNGVRTDEKELDAPYPLGETSILWQAIDASGNVAECNQTILISVVPSSENAIVSFSIEDQLGDALIDEVEKTIRIFAPIDSDVTTLTPFVEVSEFAIVEPESGASVDFTTPMTYTVTAEDGTVQNWIVSVEVETDVTPPTFEVNGNESDFETVLEVGDTYIVGAITNIIDERLTTEEITDANFVDTSVVGGPFMVVYQVSDGINISTITETVFVTDSEIIAFVVTSFTLVNAETNEDLFVITEGMQIDVNSLPTVHLDIRANTTTDVKSVRLSLEGALSTARTESLMPYALFQDLPVGDYKGNDFIIGAYTVAATPYSENSLRGDMGNLFAINFELIDSCQNFEVVLDVITDLLTCNSSEGAIFVDIRGGLSPFNYEWSHDALLNSPNATELVAGEYMVSATDANGCISTLNISLKGSELPEVSLLPFESILDTEAPIVLFEGQPFGGVYSGEGVVAGEFDPSVGKGIYEITYTYIDEATGCENSTTGEIEVRSFDVLAVESFTLINADTNLDLFELVEGMVIDINSLPTLHLDIRANTSETVESVALSLSGTINSARTESLVPYALFQDLPIGDYKGSDFVVGSYAVIGVPYSKDRAMGNLGSSFQINFELVDPTSMITEFMLVNAETNEDLFLIEEGMVIDVSDLPTLHLDIRANTTEAVESVRLSLAGAIVTARTESLVPYALFQDLPIGDYKGSDFILGTYAMKAIPYSQDNLRGERGTALTVNFEIMDANLSEKITSQMIISPNPATTETSLSFKLPVAVKVINIYDIHGRLIQTYDAEKVKYQDAYLLDVKALQSGNYFIKTVDEKGHSNQRQLLVKKK